MGFFLGDYVDSSGHRTGGFMSGLFSGASNTFELANNYMNLRDRMRQRSTADEIGGLIQRGDTSGTGGLYDTPSTSVGSGTSDATGGRFDGDSFDSDPLLAGLPKPGRIAKALKVFGDSPREGKAYGAPVDQSSPTPAASSVKKGALGRLADQPGPGETETSPSGQPSSGGNEPYPWLSQLGAALHAFGSRYDAKAQGQWQQPQPAPSYLPPQQPVGPGAPPGQGTLDTLQQHGALGSMGAGVPYAGAPNLGNQMNPLGQRIMAALTTPTAGPA